jgi:regulator of sigma E protease
MLITILATAVVLGVLIFIHELGHFLTAKLVDIEVPRFSIGFGPKVLGFRRGETEYVLSALPLGGYVKMAGMEDLEAIEGGGGSGQAKEPGPIAEPRPAPETPRTVRPRDFEAKSLPARTLVISAGVLMNLLFAYLCWSLIAMVWGVPEVPRSVVGSVVEEYLPPGTSQLASIPRGSRITAVGNRPVTDFDDLRIALSTIRPGPTTVQFENAPPVQIDIPSRDSLRGSLMAAIEPVYQAEPVLDVVADTGAAGRAGVRAGDRILSAGGQPIENWQEFVSVIETHPGQPVPLVIERDGEQVNLSVIPDSRSLPDGRAYGRIGVQANRPERGLPRVRYGPIDALGYGASETWHWVALTVDFLAGLFRGEQSARSVGGVITIADISGQAARAGLETFLNFMALLSVNLAVLNLLPIPVLDGGQLVFLGVEAVRGRALSLKQRMRLSQVGFIIILAIMAFAIRNDLLRVFGR